MSAQGSAVPNNLLVLAEDAFEIHNQYLRSAPDDLNELLQRFDYVGQQLKILSAVIEASGSSSYVHGEDLERVLLEAKAFFSRASQAGKFVRLAFDEEQKARLEKDVDHHVRLMHDFKSHLMFMASARTLMNSRTQLLRSPVVTPVRPQTGPETPLSLRQRVHITTARSDSTTIGVVSDAFSALQLASHLKRNTPDQVESAKDTVLSSSPDVVAQSSPGDREVIDLFLDETELLVERIQLYSENTVPTQHLEDLVEIASKAKQLIHDLRPTKAGMSAESRSVHLPTIEVSPHSYPDTFFGSPLLRKYALASQDLVPKAATISPQDDEEEDLVPLDPPARSFTKSSSTQTGSEGMFSMRSLSASGEPEVGVPAKEHISLNGWVRILAPKQTGIKPVTCKLDITRSEGSVCIWAVATSQRRPSSTTSASMMPTAMTPAMLMHGQEIDNDLTSLGAFRTFQHSLSQTARPIPHVLHPSAEGPEVGENYAITFHDRQYLSEEGVGPRWTTDLKYIFSNKHDRDLVRESIFGKKMLLSAGTEKITFTYIACTQHAVTLWEDETSQIKTITFYRDPPTNKAHSRSDVEYKVLGIQDMRKAERDGQPLALNVERVERDILNSSTRLTTLSTKPTKPRSRDDMSCSIHFSNETEKKTFLRLLRHRPS